MKIDTSNVLDVASVGAGLWWVIFGLPALNDIYSTNPSDKRWVLAVAMLFGSFCGLAFYVCLTTTALKALRISFGSRPGHTIATAAWIFLPLIPIFISAYVIVHHVATMN